MSQQSKIEWTDATWSPIRARHLATGHIGWHCEPVSRGCANCYAEAMNKRLGTGLPFKPGYRRDVEIFLDDEMLLAPLRWKKPRMIFVCSTTDLFAEFVFDTWINSVFAMMARCPQHTFQVLTKRSGRMREYFSKTVQRAAKIRLAALKKLDARLINELPLPNVWLGVSAEDQARADERIPDLLATPAAVRFVSYEPALGPIDFTKIEHAPAHCIHALAGIKAETDGTASYGPGLDWIICGGESGPNARPMHPHWPRNIRDQCAAAGVPFFFKQHGAWLSAADDDGQMGLSWRRVGKKAAGRLLDGIEHNGMPIGNDRQAPVTGFGGGLAARP